MVMSGKTATGAMMAVLGLAALMATGLVSTPAAAQRGYYETSPMYDDGYYRQAPPRRGYQQPGYHPDQGWQNQGWQNQGWQDRRERDRGYYHRPGQGYAPQPRFYDKEAAKDYWRAQKEAQKRAIKRGYYNQ
jgi:hypothetical protein